MSPLELLALLAFTGRAVYKQTQLQEVHEKSRFKMAFIYALVGLVVGGFGRPEGTTAWTLLAVGLALSVVVGVARGFYTRVWITPDGRTLRQGTALTIGLFIGLITVKFGLGTLAYEHHINDGQGFGEVMLMIAVVIAIQAEIVWRRAQNLALTHGRPSHRTTTAAPR